MAAQQARRHRRRRRKGQPVVVPGIDEEGHRYRVFNVDKLRRLKYRIEQKNLVHVYQDTQVIFDEHRLMQEDMMLDSKVEYEQLLHYLRKKVE